MLTVVPTIDVEGVHGTDPFEQLVLGQVGDCEEWGVFRLAEIFRRFDISATFFVDCYEYTFWGEKCFGLLCERLMELGQDVQLHTHPSWRDDPCDSEYVRQLKLEKSYLDQNFDLMAKLPYDRQVEVIEHGAALLHAWTGQRPVAHRSGGYSINEDTVRALVATGFALDSSMNVAHANSQITWSRNRLVKRCGLIELPVTVMRYCFSLPFGKAAGRIYSRLMKTDIDTVSLSEFLAFADFERTSRLRILNLFMHSYSLLELGLFFEKMRPNKIVAGRLERLLMVLSDRRDVRFMNCRELVSAFSERPKEFDGSDEIPEIRRNMKIAGLGLRKSLNAIRKQCRRQGRP